MLVLIEAAPTVPSGPETAARTLGSLAQALRARGERLVEAQVAADRSRFFLIIEASEVGAAEQAVREVGLEVRLAKPVRLVGQEVEEISRSPSAVDFIVEWNFPPGLTMEAYLARKHANSPRYALVPEVRFLRTYVCEDMSKCICFYEAEREEDVRRAREVVEAPVDAIIRVDRELRPEVSDQSALGRAE
jgi:hypothetical protein